MSYAWWVMLFIRCILSFLTLTPCHSCQYTLRHDMHTSPRIQTEGQWRGLRSCWRPPDDPPPDVPLRENSDRALSRQSYRTPFRRHRTVQAGRQQPSPVVNRDRCRPCPVYSTAVHLEGRSGLLSRNHKNFMTRNSRSLDYPSYPVVLDPWLHPRHLMGLCSNGVQGRSLFTSVLSGTLGACACTRLGVHLDSRWYCRVVI